MAGPRPNDNYSPVPTQMSNEGMPSDYLTTRANPSQAGAGVGEAMQRTGQALEGVFNTGMEQLIKEQGMLNETMTTEADNKLYVVQSDLVGKYRSMKGLEAVAAKGPTLAALQQTREEIAKTLPNNAALRAFNLMASRREAFAFTEVNNYAAGQVKEASIASSKASMELAINSVANPTIAGNDRAFGAAMGDIRFSAARMIDELGYGPGTPEAPTKTGMKQDPLTGKVSFDLTTDEGKKADSVYRSFVQKAEGDAWEARLNTLAYDTQTGDIEKAVSVLQGNKDNMPAETYAKMSHSFSGPYRTYQSRGIADQVFSEFDRSYQSANGTAPDLEAAITNVFPGSKITSRGRTAEDNARVGGVENSHHLDGNAIDFIPPVGVTKEQVRDMFTGLGVNPTELIDEKDHIHVAWKPKASGIDPNSRYQTRADYIGMNSERILKAAEDEAYKKYKDPVFAQQVRTHTAQRIDSILTQQRAMDRVDQNIVMDFVSSQLITDVSQLESAAPHIRKAWRRMQTNNSFAADRIERYVFSANANGNATTYGTDFYKYYEEATSGPIKDESYFYDQVRKEDGKYTPLSNTGMRALSRMIKERQTPEGNAFLAAQSEFFKRVRPLVTGSVLGMKDGIGDQKFNQFLMNVIPRIAAAKGRDKNVNPAELFDEKSANYVGKDINIFQRPIAERMNDIYLKGIQFGKVSANLPEYSKFETPAELKAALNRDIENGKIKTAQAKEYLRQRGFVGNEQPTVVPLSVSKPDFNN